jgi:nucleoside phosphorylase
VHVGPFQLDALIITALMDELEAVLASGEGGKEAWMASEDPEGFPFHYRELPRENGGSPLRIAATSFDEMGESVTAARATALIKHLDPACLAMCGICAGNRKDVSLGDVIIADRVYSYDDGKYFAGHDGSGQSFEEFQHNLRTYNLPEAWRVDASSFAREMAATVWVALSAAPSGMSLASAASSRASSIPTCPSHFASATPSRSTHFPAEASPQ